MIKAKKAIDTAVYSGIVIGTVALASLFGLFVYKKKKQHQTVEYIGSNDLNESLFE